MQGRYHHPSTVEPSALARLLCRVFHPTSSLATACGLQSLIDLVGPARVLCAWLVGMALKLVGSKGWFYRLAGDQARLIDDITGTTPPYDQTIVLGPERPAELCRALAAQLGVAVAVVDVNDLGRGEGAGVQPGLRRSVAAEGPETRTRRAMPTNAPPWCWCGARAGWDHGMVVVWADHAGAGGFAEAGRWIALLQAC
jgi:hypothetical protein